MSQKINSLSRDRVAKTWVFRALSDVFFAFASDDPAFESQAKFSEIMGLEKFLKAVLLYHRHKEYESLPLTNARVKLDKIARELGHEVRQLLKKLPESCIQDVERIKSGGYDGYGGEGLLVAVEQGYTETRYPVPVPVHNNFPIGETGFSHDPLGSSAFTDFVYALCNACFFELLRSVDFADVIKQFEEKFGHTKALGRFNNLFWEARCKKYPLTFA